MRKSRIFIFQFLNCVSYVKLNMKKKIYNFEKLNNTEELERPRVCGLVQ